MVLFIYASSSPSTSVMGLVCLSIPSNLATASSDIMSFVFSFILGIALDTGLEEAFEVGLEPSLETDRLGNSSSGR